MHAKTREKLILTAVGWLAAGLIFFPIFWMFLTSFKTEIEAVATPPSLFFDATLENYTVVRERADYVHFALNSVIISVGRHPAGHADRGAGRLRDGLLPG
jgi:sorbitol/mannitol transport system permease protein